MQTLLVWDALIAWRDNILKKNTLRKSKISYLSSMSLIIRKRILDLEQPLPEFRNSSITYLLREIDKTEDWSESTKHFKRKTLQTFYKFASKQEINPSNVVIPFEKYRSIKNVAISELFISKSLLESLSSNEDKAKSQSLTDLQIDNFLKEIRRINERDFLICWTMWVEKCVIHEILNLRVGDYDFIKGILKIGENDFRFGELPSELKKLILKQCEGKLEIDLIFSTAQGKPILPWQITRNMKIASKRANLPIIISPKILYAYAITYSKLMFELMPEEQRKELTQMNDKRYESIQMKNVFAE